MLSTCACSVRAVPALRGLTVAAPALLFRMPAAGTGTGQLQLEHLDLLQLRSCRRRQQFLLALRRRERRCSSRPLAARRLELLLQPPLTGAPYRRRRRWRLSRRSRRSERSQPAHLVRISPRIWPPGSRTLGRAERLQWRATRAARVGSRAAARGEGGEGAGRGGACRARLSLEYYIQHGLYTVLVWVYITWRGIAHEYCVDGQGGV